MSFADFEKWKKDLEEKGQWLPPELNEIVEEKREKKRKLEEWKENKKRKGDWLPLDEFIRKKNETSHLPSSKKARKLKAHSDLLNDINQDEDKFIQREVLFDTETTGIGKGHKIVEVSFMEVINGIKTGKFLQSFFNPQRSISKGAYLVHKITNDDVKNSPIFEDKAEEIIKFIGHSSLVAHNAQFDMGMINNELEEAGWSPYPKDRFICTLKIARHLYPGEKNKLDSLCSRFNIDNKNRLTSERHSAHEDTILLYHVYQSLIKNLDKYNLCPYDFTL